MAERGITHDDLIAGLQDIRLPADAPGGLFAELAVAVGVGLLLAVCISALLPLVTRKRTIAKPTPVKEQIAALAGLPEQEQVVALLHLLRQRQPSKAAHYAKGIYQQGRGPELGQLRAAILSEEGVDA